MTKPKYLAMSNASAERQMERLEAKMPEDRSGCWIWTGQTIKSGYGMMRVGPPAGRRDYVHRVSYRLHKGPIPDGHQIDHLCRNRACFNPEHLEAVTGHENWRRGESSTAVTHRTNKCVKGLHDLTPDNVVGNPANGRRCRACHRAWRSGRASAPKPT